MANDDEKMVRLRYDSGESGWAVDLGDGTYRIANVPYCNGLNIDDVVTVKPALGDRLPRVDRIISQGFANKIAIWYDTIEQFHAITRDLRGRGCKSEGVVGPQPGRRGALIAATPEGVDAFAVARTHGVVDPENNKSPISH